MEKKYRVVINTKGTESIQMWSLFACAKDWVIKCLSKADCGYGYITTETASGYKCLFHKELGAGNESY